MTGTMAAVTTKVTDNALETDNDGVVITTETVAV